LARSMPQNAEGNKRKRYSGSKRFKIKKQREAQLQLQLPFPQVRNPQDVKRAAKLGPSFVAFVKEKAMKPMKPEQ